MCTSLSRIDVNPLNPSYSSLDGVLFNKDQTGLIRYPEGKVGSYTFPNTVISVDSLAFFLCTGLTSVTIPDSVASIGDYAFSHCRGLTSVYFAGNAPAIGIDVFYNAIHATVYYLPGTTGWGGVYSDRPAAPWLPNMKPTHHRFGLPEGPFGFAISWANDKVVIVDAVSHLASPDWMPVSTNTIVDGTSTFTDPDWANHPSRFYRLREH